MEADINLSLCRAYIWIYELKGNLEYSLFQEPFNVEEKCWLPIRRLKGQQGVDFSRLVHNGRQWIDYEFYGRD